MNTSQWLFDSVTGELQGLLKSTEEKKIKAPTSSTKIFPFVSWGCKEYPPFQSKQIIYLEALNLNV